MASFDLDTEKVKDCAESMDIEITKYNDAVSNIITLLTKLNDPVEGCVFGTDADNYVSSINSSGDKEALTSFGENLGKLAGALNDAAENLKIEVAKNKIV